MKLYPTGLGGGSTFLELPDTPASYSGQAGKTPAVNTAETDLEFIVPAGGGDMTVIIYDGAGISEQLVGLTAIQTLTNKTLTSPAINSPTGIVKGDVGLGSVDNTSDLAKPISTAQQTALDLKEDKANKVIAFQPTPDDTHYASEKLVKDSLDGKQATGNYFDKTADTLDDIANGTTYVKSTNDYTTTEKTKLTGIEALAEVNNISDVDATDLTDSGESVLHYHSTDRARANHTGTQLAVTISDFDAGVSANLDVTANTAHRSNTANPHATSDANLDVTDIVTNNLSITAHGFAPKAPNDVTKYLDGLGAWSIPPASLTDNTNVFYVGKHGLDTNSGKTINAAFLTFGAAITSSIDGDAIVCLDGGIYTENLTFSKRYIYAPNAELRGTGSTSNVIYSSSGYSHIEFRKVNTYGTGSSAIKMYGGTLKCKYLSLNRETIGINTGDTGTRATQIDIDRVDMAGDQILMVSSSPTPVAHDAQINIKYINVDLSTYFGGYIFRTNFYPINGFIGRIDPSGAAGKCSISYAYGGNIKIHIANYTAADFNADYRSGTEIIDYGDNSTYINTDTTNFNGTLTTLDDTVQKALDTLDDLTTTIYVTKTYTPQGEIKVASGDTDVFPPFQINLNTGQTCKLIKLSGALGSGTSVTLKLQKSDGIGGAFADITGFTALVISGGYTNPTIINPTDVSLNDGEIIQAVVTAVSGTPTNFMLNIITEETI